MIIKSMKICLVILALFSVAATASDLPDCPQNVYHNCISTYTYTNGGQYVGEWKNRKKHGQGILTTADGRKYIGEFKDGNFDGKGTASVYDSFNHSSLTDVAVGQFNNTLASALGNINYSLTATLGRSPNEGGTDPAFAYMADDAFTPTSTAYRVFSTGMNDTGLQDQDRNFNAVHGDLA